MGSCRLSRIARASAPALGLALVLSSACADRLPEQDLRILTAAPSAKLPVSLLWQEYAGNAGTAASRYRGLAVEMTGDAKDFDLGVTPNGPDPTVKFPQGEAGQVTAHLLIEQAARVEAAMQAGPRITLRCFVEGLDPGGKNLTVRSCVTP